MHLSTFWCDEESSFCIVEFGRELGELKRAKAQRCHPLLQRKGSKGSTGNLTRYDRFARTCDWSFLFLFCSLDVIVRCLVLRPSPYSFIAVWGTWQLIKTKGAIACSIKSSTKILKMTCTIKEKFPRGSTVYIPRGDPGPQLFFSIYQT
jgi:hypothetical protein